jgi:hypothetical protein
MSREYLASGDVGSINGVLAVAQGTDKVNDYAL